MIAHLRISLGVLLTAMALAILPALPQAAADEVEVTISIKDHKFEPAEVKVPAGKAIKLTVKNLDSTAEEFESKPLKIEKVLAPGAKSSVVINPLKPGEYAFFDEFHPDTSRGKIVAK